LGRLVALKVLSAAGLSTPRALERFLREARIAASLAHPGIATILDSGIWDGIPYIAMRYVEGRTLAQRLEDATDSGQPLTLEEDSGPTTRSETPLSRSGGRQEVMRVVALVESVARILQAAHEAGVVHRDIKPGNIMLTPAGDPIVLDFGLARPVESDAPVLTAADEVLGTPAYMSPEQVQSTVSVGPASDVWSLGITLFECLARKRPFAAVTRHALYQAIVEEPLPDIRRLNPAVPRDLAIVLAVATDKDPQRRYADAATLADDLGHVRMRKPIRARPVGNLLRLRRWSQRNPALAVATVCAALGLLISLVLLVRTRSALHAYELLADERRLADLIHEAREDLWPAVPERVPAMDAWLARARAVSFRFERHRSALQSLREQGTPRTAATEDAATVRERAALEEERARALNWIKQPKNIKVPGQWDLWESRVRSRVRQIDERLAATKEALVTWHFADDRDQWRHEQETEFLAALEDFLADHPHGETLRAIETRRTLALGLRRRSIEDHAAAWEVARAAVAADARFGGLRLEPQLGLVPIGADPHTGLQEFAHLATGAPPQREPGSGALILTEECGIVLVLVPGGTFTMGSQNENAAAPNFSRWGEETEAPTGDVTLDPFLVSKYEMTQGQWLRATGANPSHLSELYLAKGHPPHTLLHPVERVSWFESDRLLRRLDLVLPTEAQWEYACRAGTETSWWTGVDVNSLRGAANLADQAARRWGATWPSVSDWLDDGHGPHAPVGSYAANPFGLHDVHGNVWEWCLDARRDYRNPPRQGDGLRGSAASRDVMVNRGGAYNESARYLRSAQRNALAPDGSHSALGVRPARSLR
jgi:formylglycine-generating enzyme required for sulfatase activity/tRNA A-37 threonylcarbamoyl transferase component Bud32